HAVAQAFGALLPDGHHALSALFLDVDPRHVDVNVHPTKTEVLFDDDRGVYSFVRAVVKKGLAEAGLGLTFSAATPVGPAPTVGAAGPSGDEAPPAAPVWPGPAEGDGARFEPVPAGRPETPRAPSLPSGANPDWDAPPRRTGGDAERAPSAPRSGPEWGAWPQDVPAEPAYVPGEAIPSRLGPAPVEGGLEGLDADPDRALWQLHGRYLLSPVRSGLLVVDQQAAHERILYERALASMASGMAPRQQLLFPFTVDLAPADRALLDEIRVDLAALGFDLAPGKGNAVLVRGLPADVTLGDERAVLDDLLAQYRRNAESLRLGARDNLARSLARRSSIKPGHLLRPMEARALVDQLFACEDPYTDPQGRPTLIRIPEEDIARRFRR
ncbi:MAG TPA: hypothetical protein VF576_12275, partial [Rubricoccaceae bacterium]